MEWIYLVENQMIKILLYVRSVKTPSFDSNLFKCDLCRINFVLIKESYTLIYLKGTNRRPYLTIKIAVSDVCMQITRFTDYAIRVMMMLALHENEICRTAEIANNFSISKHHLTKVIQELNRKGWVETYAGVSGGVKIKPEALDIRLSEIINTIEGFDLAECFDTVNNTCPIVSVCRLRGIWSEARDAFLGVLQKYTVRDLVERREDMEFFLG